MLYKKEHETEHSGIKTTKIKESTGMQRKLMQSSISLKNNFPTLAYKTFSADKTNKTFRIFLI